MSENSSEMSERDSRMASASSALTAWTAVKPASSTMSTARIRNTISSSTTRTFVVVGVGDVIDPEDMAWAFISPCDEQVPPARDPALQQNRSYHAHAPIVAQTLLGTTTRLRVFPCSQSG